MLYIDTGRRDCDACAEAAHKREHSKRRESTRVDGDLSIEVDARRGRVRIPDLAESDGSPIIDPNSGEGPRARIHLRAAQEPISRLATAAAVPWSGPPCLHSLQRRDRIAVLAVWPAPNGSASSRTT